MSPGIAEPVALDLRSYSLRHIGPKAAVYSNTIGKSFTILNRTDLVARPLPVSNIPNSSDFASGTWNGRLFDAGDAQVIWPNKEASDGAAWRTRFDPTSKLQWIEIWIDEFLEMVFCITKVTPSMNQVLVEGYDGYQMCKSAFQRDWVVTQSPRDTMERGTQLWQQIVAEVFWPASTITGGSTVVNTQYNTWQLSLATGGTATVGTAPVASGGIALTCSSSALSSVQLQENPTVTFPQAVQAWRSNTVLQNVALASGAYISCGVEETSGHVYSIVFQSGFAQFLDNAIPGSVVAQIQTPLTPNYNVYLESDGEWVSGYVNGQLIGMCRRAETSTFIVATDLIMTTNTASAGSSLIISSVFAEALQPFLQAGTDKGDYVLPGGPTTYPTGGLHGRYFNDLDLQGDSNRLVKTMCPQRTQAYSGSSSVSEYANQLDATIATQQNPLPGAATTYWSARWFGAIYLKLSAGNYTLGLKFPATANNFAVRVWIGKTKWGDQLLDAFTLTNTSGATSTITVTASTLAGSLPYGAGTVQRDGWYPIKIEWAVGATAGTAPTLQFTSTPVGYTDPGGTAIASGAQTTTVPTTSLSPLGCDDQRYQGTSHYDLVQKTATNFGYQFSVEPKQLESGQFPGLLAPRIREGHDSDIVLEPDFDPRDEGITNYSSLIDGTDQASSIQGNGAGFQSGQTGQLQANVWDPTTLQFALFDMQDWVDAADASFASTLDTVLNSELGLRLTPWQVITGDPNARHRLAYTWPLPGAIAQMRWRPGDGVRVLARDIGVQDVSPRQLLLVTRNIHPNGNVSTQVGFAARPKSSDYAIRKALSAALRPQRDYQHQLVTQQSDLSATINAATVTAGASTAFIATTLTGKIGRAHLHILLNSGAISMKVFVNGVDQTAILNGPWTTVPVVLDVTGVTTPASTTDNRCYFAIQNNGGSSSSIQAQLIVDTVR